MQYQKFYFESYHFSQSDLLATFRYSFDHELFFEEKVSFAAEGFSPREDLDLEVIQALLFHTHIALGISYYKCFPVNTLVVNTGSLTPEQTHFWKQFYYQGLGEFYYSNAINPFSQIVWEFPFSQTFCVPVFSCTSGRAMVPIGGGKDSIVTIELLKLQNKPFDLVSFGTKDSTLYQNTQTISGKQRLFFKRFLAPNLQEVNAQGAYNGHVPITGMIAWVLVVAAYLYEYQYVVMSNEYSANFGNVEWNGLLVNHQWSKSYEFEMLFSQYIAASVSQSFLYFSLLRPWYEIQIAHHFATLGKPYFEHFSSCNTNFKIHGVYSKPGYWCNACPKCAFVYAILRPFLSHKEVTTIFGTELYELPELRETFLELLGYQGVKPLECVGESSEVLFALRETLKIWEGELPEFLLFCQKIILPRVDTSQWNDWKKKFLDFSFNPHNIPVYYGEVVGLAG